MKKGESTSAEAAELRRCAEARLRTKTAGKNIPRTDADLRRLLHELQVHQIELEMQNEELRQAREELEASRNKYAELYDFAPVGYFTFDAHGLIREINLAGAQLLGIERPAAAEGLVSSERRFPAASYSNVVFAPEASVTDRIRPAASGSSVRTFCALRKATAPPLFATTAAATASSRRQAQAAVPGA